MFYYSCKSSYWILMKFRIVTYFHHHIHRESWVTDIQYILPDNLHFQYSRMVFLLDYFVWGLLLKGRWITTLSACTFLHNIFSPFPNIFLLLLTQNLLIIRLLWAISDFDTLYSFMLGHRTTKKPDLSLNIYNYKYNPSLRSTNNEMLEEKQWKTRMFHKEQGRISGAQPSIFNLR